MANSTASMPTYARILFKDLRLSEEYLREHEAVLRERLTRVGVGWDGPSRELDALNECIHLASSVVLCGSQNLDANLQRIGKTPAFRGQDPATIVTMAALYYLLRRESDRLTESAEKNKIDHIRRRLADMNWMVGHDAMRELGIANGIPVSAE